MSIDTATSVTTELPAAAAAVAHSWGLGDALAVGDPTPQPAEPEFSGQAVIVEFTGRFPGELALIVDDEIAQQLMDSPAAPQDLIAALGPAVTAACLAIGEINPDATQVLDPKMAVRRVLSLGDAAGTVLTDDGEARAILVLGAKPATPPATETADSADTRSTTAAASEPFAPSANRLDLLRGVHMQATVELGRTEMTINDLLSLRSGAVIELDRAAGAPADLYVNGRLIAHGEVVVVDENYGLRILQVVSDEVGR